MALVPGSFLDCVVAIGVPREEGEEGAPGWIASGFFYGRRVGATPQGVAQYSVYLVSNRHVFEGLDAAVIRTNPPADDPAPARDWPLQMNNGTGTPKWIAHPRESVDVAAIKVNYNQIRQEGMQVSFFTDDGTALSSAQLVEAGITEGDNLFVLGYPMGLVGEHRAVVIVRNGSIARIRDALTRPEESYLVDSAVFPGNSGGPVVIRPEGVALEGTSQPTRARLIGIVTGYVSFTEVAVSAQTGRVRNVFEENSGLASAHLVDAIDDCIEADPLFHQMRMQFAVPPPEEAAEDAGPLAE